MNIPEDIAIIARQSTTVTSIQELFIITEANILAAIFPNPATLYA